MTAVVVAHDGASWLPECLAALSRQSRAPQRVVAVDTGSTDSTVQLLTDTLGSSAVLTRPRDTGLGDAVQAGLEAFAGAPPPPGVTPDATEWVWVLHDDCAPDDDALEQLLGRADESPSATVIGPKVLSWDRRVLVEVGVTVDSSGRRETGLESREVDQGQHDDTTDVLAVGTAGMLVRRATWDRLAGLDRAFPLAGDDIDFGWRVTASGGRVIVAPRAVIRHAAALTRHDRKADAVATSYGAAVRGHGMAVVLANTSPWLVLPIALRLVVEGLLRAVACILVLRSPRRARDEIVGLGFVIGSAPRLIGARRQRARERERPHRQLRSLLAPPSWRIRRFGDAVTAMFAGRAAVDERQRRRAPVETGPVSAEAEAFTVDDLGVLARFVSRPGVVLTVVLTLLALVADRHLLGGNLHGGRLLLAPSGAQDLWSQYVASWHPAELGSSASAPPFVALMALLSSICFGKAWLAVDIVLLGAVPLAGLTAYLAVGRLTRRLPLRIWAAVAYALSTVGAVASGRIDVVVAAIVLPVVARGIAAAMSEATVGWATHRAFGAGLLLTVAVAAVPVLWVVAAGAMVVAVWLVAGATGGLRRIVTVLVTLAVPLAVLLPLTVRVVGRPSLLVLGSGLPEEFASRAGVSAADLVLLHPGGPAQPPLWVWAPIVLAAVAALAASRRAARAGFVVLVAGLAGAVIVSRLTPQGVVSDARYWSGALLLVALVGALAAAVAGADAAPQALRRAAFGWRQPALALLLISGVAGTVTTGVVWLTRGTARPLSDSSTNVLPVFAQAGAAAPTSPRTLLVRSDGGVVHYALLRGPAGLRLADADVVAPPGAHVVARRSLATAVSDAAAGRDRAAGELAEFGISLIVVPDDTSGTLQQLAAVTGLARVPATSTVVYRATTNAGELAVLDGGDAASAATGASLSSTAQPQLLDAAPGAARTHVGASGADRLLVLAEPHSSAWRARLDGTPLAGATAYGWAQAWRIPAGASGQLVVSRSDGSRELLLAAQLVALVAAAALSVPVRGLSS